MNYLDYTVLFSTILFVIVYGHIKTKRKKDNINTYLRGDQSVKWSVIGLSIMATQASAITFISTPALGYTRGLDYIQNYLGLPLALIVIAAFIIPIYQRLKVYTAYEYLEKRFDLKTRLLTASLFLVVRGLSAGMTIFAPTIILSKMLDWPLVPTTIIIGVFVTAYTILGGTQGVSVTQKYQMIVMLLGVFFIFFYCLSQLPDEVGIDDAFTIAGRMGHLNAINPSFDLTNRYNLWNGIIAGFFLALSYFGTDQSQVQRYLVGGDIIKSRLGLIFNAIFKIPLQFIILLTGVMVFIFYQFTLPDINFRIDHDSNKKTEKLKKKYEEKHQEKKLFLEQWLSSKDEKKLDEAVLLTSEMNLLKTKYNATLLEEGMVDKAVDSQDKNFVFISYILTHTPHGFIGFLIAMILAAAMSSSAAELNALGTTSMIDFLQRLFPKIREKSEKEKITYSKMFTLFWGALTIIVALNGNLVENLIEAINIIGSLFYGVILGIFLAGFFFKKLTASQVFISASFVQMSVFITYFVMGDDLAYLWYNLSAIPVIMIAYLLSFLKTQWR